MSACFRSILNLCERNFFVKTIVPTNEIETGKVNFILGPTGQLLKNNIYQEWINSSVIHSEENVFPFSLGQERSCSVLQDYREIYEFIKQLSNNQLPFGIAESVKVPASLSAKYMRNTEESRYFWPGESTCLRERIFTCPADSMQFFYQWQRQRKMWWRKFSYSPGKFILADVQCEEGTQSVEIRSQFPWGEETIEVITHHGQKYLENANKEDLLIFEARDGRKKVIPDLVESSVNLDGAVMSYLCDAYEEAKFLEESREVMRFHRRLSPYKISFAASATSASCMEELTDLSKYLTKLLRRAGVSTLLLPDVMKKSLEAQFKRNDEMGVPYTAVLNEPTLKNGILGLRSRDTTLKEQVHIGDLKNYMELILKNY